MAQTVFATFGLLGAPLDAAAHFYSDHVPKLRKLLKGESLEAFPDDDYQHEIDALVVVFQLAGKEHQAWRLAAIQELAREAAPKRVNGVAGDDPEAIRQATDWLAQAPGVTGQLLAVDGKSGTKV